MNHRGAEELDDGVLYVKSIASVSAIEGWEQPIVYAHEEVPANFDRYVRTNGWNSAINTRQFGFGLTRLDFPAEFRHPDMTYADTTPSSGEGCRGRIGSDRDVGRCVRPRARIEPVAVACGSNVYDRAFQPSP